MSDFVSVFVEWKERIEFLMTTIVRDKMETARRNYSQLIENKDLCNFTEYYLSSYCERIFFILHEQAVLTNGRMTQPYQLVEYLKYQCTDKVGSFCDELVTSNRFKSKEFTATVPLNLCSVDGLHYMISKVKIS
jgi:hypothetical protein